MRNTIIDKQGVMAPKRYNGLLKHVDLAEIYVSDSKVTCNKFISPGVADLHLDESFKIIKSTSEKVVIEAKYVFKAKIKKRNFLTINVKYNVVLQTSKHIPIEFFEIYNKASLPFHIYPFFREFVHSTISHMGLPTLILPLRKQITAD